MVQVCVWFGLSLVLLVMDLQLEMCVKFSFALEIVFFRGRFHLKSLREWCDHKVGNSGLYLSARCVCDSARVCDQSSVLCFVNMSGTSNCKSLYPKLVQHLQRLHVVCCYCWPCWRCRLFWSCFNFVITIPMSSPEYNFTFKQLHKSLVVITLVAAPIYGSFII